MCKIETFDTIKLPCKIGQTLYREDGLWQCQGFDCDEQGTWRVKLRREAEGGYYYTRMVFGSFGKKIFASKEEYEEVFPPKRLSQEYQERINYLNDTSKAHNEWLLR